MELTRQTGSIARPLCDSSAVLVIIRLLPLSSSPSIATVALPCIFSEIKRDRLSVENRDFSYPWIRCPR